MHPPDVEVVPALLAGQSVVGNLILSVTLFGQELPSPFVESRFPFGVPAYLTIGQLDEESRIFLEGQALGGQMIGN